MRTWNLVCRSVLMAAAALAAAVQARAQASDSMGLQTSGFAAPLAQSTSEIGPAAGGFAPEGKVIGMSTRELLNRQWKASSYEINLNGVAVKLSGLLSRKSNLTVDKNRGYLVLYSPSWGKVPLLFNLQKLVTNEAEVPVNGVTFAIHVEPDLEDPKHNSILKIVNKSDNSTAASLTLGEVLKITHEAGVPVALYGTDYRLFMVSDVVDNSQAGTGTLNRKVASIVLMRPPTDGKDYPTFLYDYASMTDDVQAFPLENGKTVGLRVLGDGTLEVYQSPS